MKTTTLALLLTSSILAGCAAPSSVGGFGYGAFDPQAKKSDIKLIRLQARCTSSCDRFEERRILSIAAHKLEWANVGSSWDSAAPYSLTTEFSQTEGASVSPGQTSGYVSNGNGSFSSTEGYHFRTYVQSVHLSIRDSSGREVWRGEGQRSSTIPDASARWGEIIESIFWGGW